MASTPWRIAIDLVITQSPNGTWNGQTARGVYEPREGQLKLCLASPTAPRPQTLEPVPASLQTMAVMVK